MKMTKNGTYSYSYVGTYNRLAKFQTLSIALLPSGAIYIVCLVLFLHIIIMNMIMIIMIIIINIIFYYHYLFYHSVVFHLFFLIKDVNSYAICA